MNYIRLHITCPNDYQELLIAELFDLDFDGFEEEENLLIASIASNQFDDVKRQDIERALSGIEGAEIKQEEIVEPQNWNSEWEKTIQPQTIGKFYVTPTWGAPLPDDSDLTKIFIDPKMAFGTGYHATTRLVLEFLQDIITPDNTVLDAGTGTGILGIATLKLGASSVFGFDIDEWSEDNCKENIELNKVTGFDVKLGSTEVIPQNTKYDVILANINRNALIELLPILLTHLSRGGKLLLSGLLENDEETMLLQPSLKSLTHIETRQQQEWIALLFTS